MKITMPKLAPLKRDTIARLKTVSSGTLTTQLLKRGFYQRFLVGVHPLNPKAARFAGEAFTMRFIPAREDIDSFKTLTTTPNPDNLQWVAAEGVPAGQVLVIDSREDARAASAGNILVTRLMKRGVAAVVSDGAFRDGAEIAAMKIPVYAREVTATSRLSYHRVADLQVPIGCAGVAVYPGDVIVGDADGVTVVPRHLADELAESGPPQDELETYILGRIQAGEALWGVYPPSDETRAAFAKAKRGRK